MNVMIDMIVTFTGAYLVYSAIDMKRTGTIPKGVMVSRDTDLTQAKDIPGFIKYVYLKSIIIGICAVLCGVIGMLNDRFGGLGLIQLIMTVIFFIVLVLYGFVTVRARKKYLGI